MAKTKEELNSIIAEIEEKLKGLDVSEIAEVVSALREKVKDLKKDEVSQNFAEDTVPVGMKDISAGLRNY